MDREQDAGTVHRPVLVIALLCSAQFVLVLDVSIVNIAMPSIGSAYGRVQSELQWLVTGYVLTFGGFLLAGGRAGDLFGRRRFFVLGLGTFSSMSLVAAAAPTYELLVAARCLQGVGAAMASPAALSLLSTTFATPSARARALGAWGATSAVGGVAGNVLGGLLTSWVHWRAIFVINLPFSLFAIGAAFLLLADDRSARHDRHVDVAGAFSVTAALGALIFALDAARSTGWDSTRTLTAFALSALLVLVFLVVERRSRAPIVSWRLVRRRPALGNLTVAVQFGTTMTMAFVASLYMQSVLGYSAFRAGVAFVPLALTVFVCANVASRLVVRVGPRRMLVTGFALLAIGLTWMARIPTDGRYAVDLLPAFLVMAVGMGAATVSALVVVTSDVQSIDQGLIAGLFSTSQQVGGAIALATLVTFASTRTEVLLDRGIGFADAATSGYRLALAVSAACCVVAAIAIRLVLPAKTDQHPSTQARVPDRSG